jgi:hypothetical protein
MILMVKLLFVFFLLSMLAKSEIYEEFEVLCDLSVRWSWMNLLIIKRYPVRAAEMCHQRHVDRLVVGFIGLAHYLGQACGALRRLQAAWKLVHDLDRSIPILSD